MAETTTCPKCGAALPGDAPAGICPKCLMRAGMASEQGAASRPEIAATTPGSGFVPPQPQELARHFPQLEIIRLIGKGGMGAVYQARQPGLDRLVAVKVLPPEVGADPAFAERFVREARALAKLSHQNIVSIFDFGQAGGLYYFIMEFVDGANLRHLIETRAIEPEEALAIVPQICEALQFAHEAGIVHRDIKPENILLDKQGRVRIADFGLAKLLGEPTAARALTGTHQVMGTLHYMAPEQLQGARSVDHRADIYSLGVVFYEMVTGELPVGRFEPPSTRVQIDVRLDDVVLRSLESRPERRYQAASDVKTDVESIREDAAPGQVARGKDSSAADSADAAGESSPRIGGLVYASLRSTVFAFVLFFAAWTLLGYLFELRTPGAVLGVILVGGAGYLALRKTRNEFSMLGRGNVRKRIAIPCLIIAVVLYGLGMVSLGMAIDEKWERSTLRYESSRLEFRKATSWAEGQVPDLLRQLDPEESASLKPRLHWGGMSWPSKGTVLGDYLIAVLLFGFAAAAAAPSLRLPRNLACWTSMCVPVIGLIALAAVSLIWGVPDVHEPEHTMEEQIETFVVEAKLDDVRANLEASLAGEGYRLTSTMSGRAFMESERGGLAYTLTVHVIEAEPKSIFDRWRPRRQWRVMPHLLIILLEQDHCIVRIDMGKLRDDAWPGRWQQWCLRQLLVPLKNEAAKAEKPSDESVDGLPVSAGHRVRRGDDTCATYSTSETA